MVSGELDIDALYRIGGAWEVWMPTWASPWTRAAQCYQGPTNTAQTPNDQGQNNKAAQPPFMRRLEAYVVWIINGVSGRGGKR